MNDQQPDPRPGFYYVSVVRGSDCRLLRGPFVNDHAGALAAVEAAKAEACRLDPRAHWYAFGTCRLDKNAGPGILDRRAPVHYQTGHGTLCSLDNDASVREPTADRSTVTCTYCLGQMKEAA